MDATVLDDAGIESLARLLIARARRLPARRRLIVGIAGIPGSGKSTLAERLLTAVEAVMPGSAALVPMDGFHLSNVELQRRGLHDRKGAPETFDAAAYLELLRRCRQVTHAGVMEQAPVYDRTVHESVASDAAEHCVTEATRVVLTEGNYLLLNRGPWAGLSEVLDEGWLLDVPMEQARAWVMARHVRVGRSPAEAERKYAVDRVNAELVRTSSRPAHRTLRWPIGDEA